MSFTNKHMTLPVLKKAAKAAGIAVNSKAKKAEIEAALMNDKSTKRKVFQVVATLPTVAEQAKAIVDKACVLGYFEMKAPDKAFVPRDLKVKVESGVYRGFNELLPAVEQQIAECRKVVASENNETDCGYKGLIEAIKTYILKDPKIRSRIRWNTTNPEVFKLERPNARAA